MNNPPRPFYVAVIVSLVVVVGAIYVQPASGQPSRLTSQSKVIHGSFDLGLLPTEIDTDVTTAVTPATWAQMQNMLIGRKTGPSWRTGYGVMTITSLYKSNGRGGANYSLSYSNPNPGATAQAGFCIHPDPGEHCWNLPTTWAWGSIFDNAISWRDNWYENVALPCEEGALIGIGHAITGQVAAIFGERMGFWEASKSGLADLARKFFWASAIGGCYWGVAEH